ncbi:class A beta-lactamase [Methylobacterium sp. J-092]|uniref:class A beta-lactamase n=1 Tax=Methylobacterium sp. J-092 TaxID=2836667 RepID=UPI001FBB2024|nr:class A beta-lactamase [Methylobacterium sp. J-092]MCJ2006517.1 class A beta-lactamase [Methylobacterium sp. J-092]
MAHTRRAVVAGLALAGPALSARAADRLGAAARRIGALEARLGGRVGVAFRDATGVFLGHRADEAFALCSTFKVLAAAAILARVAAGRETLDRRIAYGADDLQSYAPVTRSALDAAGGGRAEMSVDGLCAAAIVRSDNTAANLLLDALGGPAALTAWLRGQGDAVTRLDRTEPTLNTALPGDPRDTTSPAAITRTLDRCLLGDALAPPHRARLEAWMVACETGGAKLRAGLPPAWPVGDKTGSGDNATSNVVAILHPPGRAPIFAGVFLTGSEAPPAARDAAHAEIGRILAEAV